MIEMMKTAMSGFTSYISNNHMLVLALAAAVWILVLREKKNSVRVALLALGMSLALWIPITGMILMKLQTSFYGYESLWSGLVAVPALIALGGVVFLQWEERRAVHPEEEVESEKKPRHLKKVENAEETVAHSMRSDQTKLGNGTQDVKLAMGAALVFLAIFLLGSMGRIQVVDANENDNTTELRQLISMVVMEQSKGGDIGRDKLWAPSEIVLKAREMNGDITLLYGRDLWEGEAAAYSYDSYEADSIALYEFMESLKEGDPYDAITDEAAYETAMSDRGIIDGMVIAYAKMMGSGLWVMPKSAESRVNYALEVLEEEYGYKVDVVSNTVNYIIYRIEE